MEDQWLTAANRLQAIASTGLFYSKEKYERERYEEIAAIANDLLSWIATIPVSRIRDLVSDFAEGYATPKVDVRGAVFAENKVLLVKEISDGRWTLPGGFADVGKSASENVVKEIWEEASIRVRASALYGVRHKAKHSYEPDARDFYKLFFICEELDGASPKPGVETDGVGFFGLDELPPLSLGRVLQEDIAAAFAFHERPASPALFD